MKPLTEVENAAIFPFGGNLKPHPDGKPWDKCCGTKGDKDCMCFTRKPKNAPSRYDLVLDPKPGQWWPNERAITTIKALIAQSGRFMCCHRKTDDGYLRECAGWAAKLNHRGE